MNILFTSVGRRVELLQFWKKTINELDVNGKIYGTDIDPLAPAMQIIDNGFIVPRTDNPDFISSIIAICNSNKINLIFPLIDPDIPVLSRMKPEIEAYGSKLVLINKEYVKISQDKWYTFDYFKSLGLKTPLSFLPNDKIDLSEFKYPVFIKPRTGSASIGAQIANSKQHLGSLLKNTENPIIQEYIKGVEITCDVICNLKGEIISVIQRQRIEVRSGEVSKGKTVFHKEVMEGCIRIAKSIKAIGPITIQCILKENTPYFIEINPRYGGGAPLGIAAGANSPAWYIKELLGIPFEAPKPDEYKKNLYMTRADQTLYIEENDLKKFKSYNI